ncbi:MAG TPA: VOC family protein [Rhizomicrobium sp.]|nr:VOC family protein [Rhizomicrobium sp.]
MPLTTLQHVNIRCADIDRSRAFYAILGLREGERPPFASRGFWMYLGKEPVVHLVEKKPDEPVRGPGTGELDHVAFGADDIEAVRTRLRQENIPFREAVVPRDQSVQIFVQDPDGVQLELNFPA